MNANDVVIQAYVWSSSIEASKRRKFYAVLEVPPVASARDELRPAFVADHKNEVRDVRD
jgi:hypothetical protein